MRTERLPAPPPLLQQNWKNFPTPCSRCAKLPPWSSRFPEWNTCEGFKGAFILSQRIRERRLHLNLHILIHDCSCDKGDIQRFSYQTKEAPGRYYRQIPPPSDYNGLSNAVIPTKGEGGREEQHCCMSCCFFSTPVNHFVETEQIVSLVKAKKKPSCP